jgi:hypothetical protein
VKVGHITQKTLLTCQNQSIDEAGKSESNKNNVEVNLTRFHKGSLSRVFGYRYYHRQIDEKDVLSFIVIFLQNIRE